MVNEVIKHVGGPMKRIKRRKRVNKRVRRPRTGAKKVANRLSCYVYQTPAVKPRRLHIAKPSSASEIVAAMSISSTDIDAAIEALES